MSDADDGSDEAERPKRRKRMDSGAASKDHRRGPPRKIKKPVGPRKRTVSNSDSESSASESHAPPARVFRAIDDPFSTGVGFEQGTPWVHDAESDDSDAYDSEPETPGHNRVYRALSAQENPHEDGIKPANPRSKKTLAKHVGGGGKSKFVSLTTNKRKAVKWALAAASDNPPRVATIDLPHDTPLVDFSDPVAAQRAKLGNTAKNFARSSSEVVHKGKVPKKAIKRVETLKGVRKIKPGQKIVTTRLATSATEHKKRGKTPRTFVRTTEAKSPSSRPGASRPFPKRK